ncbi:unnamed protein product [Prorocentrum cordatum]|uniref:Uncharacterized protein n=1 Tax=Prorocentrum cordatum TaxID=2364126 RepID=A0ABN9XRB6_9DINO|nr:unnamed protein product [Polarella glacialis]
MSAKHPLIDSLRKGDAEDKKRLNEIGSPAPSLCCAALEGLRKCDISGQQQEIGAHLEKAQPVDDETIEPKVSKDDLQLAINFIRLGSCFDTGKMKHARRDWPRQSADRATRKLSDELARVSAEKDALHDFIYSLMETDGQVLDRLMAVLPALRAALEGMACSGIARLRRKVAMYAVAMDIRIATAGPTELKRAQAWSRLQEATGSLAPAAGVEVQPAKFTWISDATPFKPSGVVDEGDLNETADGVAIEAAALSQSGHGALRDDLRDLESEVPVTPVTPVAPGVPVAPIAPVAPVAPVPVTVVALVALVAAVVAPVPVAPVLSVAPVALVAPVPVARVALAAPVPVVLVAPVAPVGPSSEPILELPFGLQPESVPESGPRLPLVSSVNTVAQSKAGRRASRMAGPFAVRVLEWAGGVAGAYLSRCPACPAVPDCHCAACPPCPALASCSCPPCPACPGCPGGAAAPAAPAWPPPESQSCPAPTEVERAGAPAWGGLGPGWWLVLGVVLGCLLAVLGQAVVRGGLSCAKAREWAFVLYADDEHLWHQRLILGLVGLSDFSYVVLTPDGDVYAEDYGDDSVDVAAVRFSGAWAAVPAGVPPGRVYRFRQQPTAQERARALADAQAEAQAECQRIAAARGDPGLLANFVFLRPLPVPGGAPAAPRAARIGPLQGAAPGAAAGAPVAEWRAAMAAGPYRYGDVVTDHARSGLAVGKRDIHVLPDGVGIFVEHVDPTDEAEFFDRAVATDARSTPIRRNRQDKRERTWAEMTAVLKQESFGADWQLPGPRSSLWCIEFINQEGSGLLGHHERFKTACRLDWNSWGVFEHFNICQALTQGLLVDQLDGSNLIMVEYQFRRLQTIEFGHSERAREAESKSYQGKMSLGEQHAFAGTTRASSTLMICPDLLDYVRTEVEREAKLAKNLSAVSRSVRQRVGARAAAELDCDRAVRSLNGMFSHAPQPALGQGAPACAFVSRAQREAIDFVEESARALGAPPPGLTPAEALRKLRVASWYDVDSAKLGSYRPDAISLPSGTVRPIPLETLWGSGGSDTAKDFISQNLLCSERAKQRLQGVGLERAYSDPALRRRGAHEEFIRMLQERGLVDFAESGIESVEAFFVEKKDQRLRMVIDCRRANAWFAEPAGVSLCTGDALSRLELGLNDELHIQGADLSDAFYHMGLPEELRGYFSFRPVRASAVGIKLLGGKPLGRGALVTPRLAVLPMGWSWALWWCQRVHERTSVEAGACPEQRIVDRRPPPPMTPGAHLEYVDNFIAIGTDSEWAAALVRRVSDALRARGLEVKAEDHAGELPGESEALGWCIDRGRCIVRPTRARLWRARLAVRGVLGRGRLRGRDLEKLLGHLVFISLIKREGMSLFWSCYAFVRKCYDKETGLWPAVRRELEYWDGIAPLLWRSLRSPWTDELIVVDASEWGIGACAAPAPASLVQRLGHVSERWRWHHGLAGSAPRRHAGAAAAAAALAGDPADAAPWMLGAEAVAAAGFPPRHAGGDGLGGEDSALHSHDPQTQAAGAAEGAAGSAFDEVPPDVIKLPWRTVGRHRWRWPEESMPVAEARAVLHGLQHLVRASRHRGRRVVVLGDSLSAAGAVDRFRSNSCKMLRVTQAIAAVTLVTATTLHYRWLPSEWNAADNPSRGRFSPSTPQPLLPRAKAGAAGPGAAGPPGRPADVGAGAAARGAAARPDGLGDADPVYVQASGDVEARGPRRRPAAASPPAKKRRRVAATAAAAARRRSAAVQLPGLSVLETGSITAATRAQYVEAFDGFQAWMAERGVQPTTLDDYDEQLVLRLDELYLDGEGIGAGQKLFASVLFFLGLTKAAGSPMARARRALRGFRRLAPPTSRLPLPFELPAALVNYLVSVSKLEAALVLWLSFELYLRPSEPYHIRATDLVRPARGRLGHDSWSVTLHAAETEVLSKTAEYDEALKLDLPRQELLGPALEASVTARGAAPEPLLFAITQREVSCALSAAAKALGIEKFLPGLHPYMLRHGGASHDYGSKARSLVDVQRRGRWQSWHSVRRYEKGARLSQVLQMVPAAMQDHAARCADSLGEIVSGRRCPFTPP